MPIFSFGGGGSSFALPGTHLFNQGNSAAGSYTSTSTTFVAIDATNLDATLTVKSGQIAWALFTCPMKANAGHASRVGIAIDGTMGSFASLGGSGADQTPLTCQAVLVGDGSSHTFSPRFQTDSGGTVGIWSTTGPAGVGTLIPTLMVLVLSAS